MLERRSLGVIIVISLCLSLWHIMIQQQQNQYFEPPPTTTTIAQPPINYSVSLPASSHQESQESTNNNNNIRNNNELPKSDYSQLIDIDNFEFLIGHEGCKNLDPIPLIVILIHSAPDNFQKRSVIRETWGSFSQDSETLLIFLIGAVNSSLLQEKIDLENKLHKDLVQGNFEDTYRNLTYKHVMGLKWFVYNCPDSRYLLKTDDDVFVNLPLMYNYLKEPEAQFYQKRLIFCKETTRAKVKRTFRSKWRVGYDEYLDKYFPNHCPGFSILYSSDAVEQLYREAQKLPYFWIDDVHITGNVATNLNISIIPTNEFLLTKEQQSDLLSGVTKVDDVVFFFALPNLEELEIRSLWKLISDSVNAI